MPIKKKMTAKSQSKNKAKVKAKTRVKAKPAAKVKAKPGAKVKAKTKVKAKPAAKTQSAVKKKAPAKAVKASKKQAAARPRSADPASNEALRALPADYGDAPDMPVGVAVAEFAALHRLARTVAAPLEKVGITAQQRDTLGRLVTRLKSLEAAWQRARASVRLGAGERQKLADAEALNKQLLAGGRWALRKDAAAQAELSRIAEGAGLVDTIADLRELVTFWSRRASAMKYTDITSRDLTRASSLADVLEDAAAKETDSLDAATKLNLRNRCFWAADELCRELREAGRYAFRLEPKIAAKFTSRYRISANRRTRQKPKNEQPATPAPAPAPNGV